MKKTLLAAPLAALVLAIATALPARAAPASQASVEDLLALSRAETTMDSLYAGVESAMREGMRQGSAGRPLTAEQVAVMDKLSKAFAATMREELGWARMRPLIVGLYQETFEQEEVDGLIAFYRSPAGQAFLNKMPQLMQRSFALSQQLMQEAAPRMRAAIEQALREADIQPPR